MLFVVLGHSLPFDPPKNPKMKNSDKKKKKKCLEVLSLCTCVLQMTIMMYGSWYIKHGRQNFLSFWAVSCPFTPNNPENQHFEKIKKSSRRHYHFTHVYHKWQSSGIWFLWHQLQQTDFFVIFGHFLPFYDISILH